MAYNFIQPPADTGQAGAKRARFIDITEVSGPASGNTVQQQIVSIGDPLAAGNQVNVFAAALMVQPGGKLVVSVPTNTSVNVKTTSSVLMRALVTAAGTNATASVQFYDNTAAGGLLIGILPASVNVTGVPFTFENPAQNGIFCVNPPNGPQLSVSVL